MDGFQLSEVWSHFEETVYFLPLSSRKFLVLILLTSEGWKTELILESPSGFEHGTTGLEIQCLNPRPLIPHVMNPLHGNYPDFDILKTS